MNRCEKKNAFNWIYRNCYKMILLLTTFDLFAIRNFCNASESSLRCCFALHFPMILDNINEYDWHHISSTVNWQTRQKNMGGGSKPILFFIPMSLFAHISQGSTINCPIEFTMMLITDFILSWNQRFRHHYCHSNST